MHPSLFLPLFVLFSATPIPSPSPCPQILPTTRLVGAHPAPLPAASFMATLHDPFRTPTLRCTAVLLSPSILITASACNPTKGWFAKVGGYTVNDGVRIRVANVTTPPPLEIDGRDVAIVQLDAVFANAVALKVNERQRVPFVGSYVRGFGYGGDGSLREVDIRVIGNGKCATMWKGAMDVSRAMVCAGGEGCGSCEGEGDFGGGLVQFEKGGHGVLVGILVRSECGGRAGVFVRVSRVKRWLERVVEGVRFSGGAKQVFDKKEIEGFRSEIGGWVGAMVLVGFLIAVVGVWGGWTWWEERKMESESESSVDYAELILTENEDTEDIDEVVFLKEGKSEGEGEEGRKGNLFEDRET